MKELYVSLSGAVAREKQLALVANNLANVQSIGFKKEQAVFEVRPPEPDLKRMEKSADPRLDLPKAFQRVEGDRNFVRLAASVTDHSSGAIRTTGNLLDVALDSPLTNAGAAFFVVETPQGDRYTRSGNFLLNNKNELVTPSGLRVKGDGGKAIVLDDSKVVISKEGEIAVGGKKLASFDVIYFDKPELLEKQGFGLYSDRGGQVAGRSPVADDRVAVRQASLELSNVNIVEELVQMIELQRAYTTHEKAIQTMDEATGKVVDSVMNG